MSGLTVLSLFAVILAMYLFNTTTGVPVPGSICQSSKISKLTCRHQSEAKKKVWKKCVKAKEPHHQLTSFYQSQTGLNIPFQLSINALPAMEIPPNTFRCFAVQKFAFDESLNECDCPALCKLYNQKVTDDCKIGNLLYTGFLESHGIATVESPRFGCSNYSRSELCIYNVSMPCQDDYVTISPEASQLDIAEGDSLEIIDYSKHVVYPSITGSNKESLNQPIFTSNFLLLFLSEKDSTQGAGFRLQFECPTNTTEEVENESSSSGSAF